MKQNDEYIWQNYTQEYKDQLLDVKNIDRQDFFIERFEVDDDGNIEFFDNLHPNWKEIYSIAYSLQPKSILECGCGAGYHMKNLMTILPKYPVVHGVDLLRSQIEFSKEFSQLPESMYENICVMDMTKEKPARPYEFVFSQAVIMHLSTENAIAFLNNMKLTSSKYVFLVEGVKNHEDWFGLVKSVFTEDEWDLKIIGKYIDYGILLTKKTKTKKRK